MLDFLIHSSHKVLTLLYIDQGRMHEYSEMFKFNHKPFRFGRLDHLRNVCLQILSVAVYNHYKRIYYESVQKGNVKPTNEGYMVYKPDMFGDLLEHVEEFIAVLYPFSY